MRNNLSSAKLPLRASETRANLVALINGPRLTTEPEPDVVIVKLKPSRKVAKVVKQIEKTAARMTAKKK